MSNPSLRSLTPTQIRKPGGSAPVPHPRSSHAAGLLILELTASPRPDLVPLPLEPPWPPTYDPGLVQSGGTGDRRK